MVLQPIDLYTAGFKEYCFTTCVSKCLEQTQIET